MAWTAQHGAVVGGYQLEFELGRGGFGTVWRAIRVADGDRVAIKFLRGDVDRSAMLRFEREAEVLRSLRHPNWWRSWTPDTRRRPARTS